MQLPEGFEDLCNPGDTFLLRKSIYGLRQTGRCGPRPLLLDHCRRWEKRTKSKTQPLQVYMLLRAWEKSHDQSHDIRSCDQLKIEDDIIKVTYQI